MSFLASIVLLAIELGLLTTTAVGEEACEGPGYYDVQVQIQTDRYGSETSWDIKNIDKNNEVVESGEGYSSSTLYNDIHFCLPADSCYEFTIYDSYGDGLCCGHGDGSYRVSVDGRDIATGGEFEDEESTFLCYKWGGLAKKVQDGWLIFNPLKTTWVEHEDIAIECGGHLASIHSPEEDKAAFDFVSGICFNMNKTRGQYFIGGTDEEIEGQWEWIDGSAFTDYTNWSPGEPNNANNFDGEHGLEVLESGDGWNDVPKDMELTGLYKVPELTDCKLFTKTI